MTNPSRYGHFYPRVGKRLFDLVFGALGLVLAIPLLAVLSLFALCLQGAPLLFRQVRPGKDERRFTLLKLRTMKPATGSAPDAERLTPIGRFLRRTSLDELPSLWNVVRGEMSLVGPRPLLEEYLPMYTDEQRRRHSVRPGLTGWAQVRGRNALTWPQKFTHDVWYVDNCSLALDLKIIVMTLSQVIRGRGTSAPNHATMPKFQGPEND